MTALAKRLCALALALLFWLAAAPAQAQPQSASCTPGSVALTLAAGLYDPTSPAYISPTPSAQFVFNCSAVPAGNYYYKLTVPGSNPRQMLNPNTSTPLAYQLCAQVSGNACTTPWTAASPIAGGSISLPQGNPVTVTMNVFALIAPQQSVDGDMLGPYMEVISGIQLFLCRNNPCP